MAEEDLVVEEEREGLEEPVFFVETVAIAVPERVAVIEEVILSVGVEVLLTGDE